MNKTTVALGSDDAGYALKESIKSYLEKKGVTVVDYGAWSPDPVDYPDVAHALAKDIAAQKHARGILVCGTGIGMAIVANKVPGVRAAQAHDTYSAQRASKSNNAQILTVGARVIGPELANEIVAAWLNAEFEEGGSRRKVDKINQIDAHEHQSSRSTPPSSREG